LPAKKINIPGDRQVFSVVIQSPVGALTLLAVDEGLTGLLFEATRLVDDMVLRCSVRSTDHPVLRECATQVEEYFRGERTAFDLPLLLGGTGFQRSVWRELVGIPYGTTISYGALAGRVGDAAKARAVGGAVGRNPVGVIIPCHRVIGAGGALTGFGGGLGVKAALLDLERRRTDVGGPGE
jgi:methylated-DNA-[protein]-cysteine S-methyltransferase